MAAQFSVNDDVPWKARFLTIWSGQAISLLGSQLVQFSLVWYLTVQTGSATVLATATFISLLPSVVFGPFIGTLVDRWNRRTIMILADSVITLATIVLAVLFVLDSVAVGHIYALMFVRSVAGSFHSYAMTASSSLMVPKEHLTRIQGVNQMLNGGLNIVAAPLGAILLSILPMQRLLAIDVSTALFAILPLLVISIPEPEEIESTGADCVWEEFKAGIRYVISWRGLLIVSLMTVVINFTIIPAFSLMPLLVNEYFNGSAIHLAWVESAMGIGIVIGGAILGIRGSFGRNIVTSLFGLTGMGIGTLIFAVAPRSAIELVVAGSFMVGVMTPITTGPVLGLIQAKVAPQMQARVLSLLSSVGAAMVPIGLMFAGPIADHAGIQIWYIFGGVACVFMAIVGFYTPAVRNMDGNDDTSSILTEGVI